MFVSLTKCITICGLPIVKQKNPNGQALLASTIAPHPNQGDTHRAASDMPFGSVLLQALVSGDVNGDMEVKLCKPKTPLYRKFLLVVPV
jgi:hypothetical protein